MTDFSPQSIADGLIFSRVPSRERKMVWSRYPNDTSFVTNPFPASGLLTDCTSKPASMVDQVGGTGGSFTASSGVIGGANASASYFADFPASQECAIDIAAIGASDRIEVMARLQDPWVSTVRGYRVVALEASAEVLIEYFDDDGAQTLRTISQDVAADDGLGIRCHGAAISAWVRSGSGAIWEMVGYALDDRLISGGSLGISVLTASAQITNWYGGEFYSHERQKGVHFNAPVKIEADTEWVHPFFDLVRSYSPTLFVTLREAETGAMDLVDYSSSSPQTLADQSTSYHALIDGPFSGHKGFFMPDENTTSPIVGDGMSGMPTTEITVGVWLKQWYTANWYNYVSTFWPGDGGWLLFSDVDNVNFGVADGGTQYVSGRPASLITDGEWHFVVGTYDGTDVTVYVDGVGGTPDSVSSVALEDAETVYVFGGDSDVAFGPSFIIPSALSAAEVLGLYETATMYEQTSTIDRYRVTSITDGGPDLRGRDEPVPGDHGDIPQLERHPGGRSIVISGRIEASNMAMLRYMEDKLRRECSAVGAVDSSMDNGRWSLKGGTLSILDPGELNAVVLPSYVAGLKIAEGPAAEPTREFNLTLRAPLPSFGVAGAKQYGDTVNLIGGATIFSTDFGDSINEEAFETDLVVRIGNYPTGATAAISGSLVISTPESQITIDNPVWGTDEWWEIDSRDSSIKLAGLSASAYNRSSFLDMATTDIPFLTMRSWATLAIARTGTVSTGTPKIAVFAADNIFV